VDNLILQKIIIIVIFAIWIVDVFRTKKKRSDPVIEEADARERYTWRYLRWGGRVIQVIATVYIIVQFIQFLLV
jgi:hypothetical protein